jgi:alpha-glucosidase
VWDETIVLPQSDIGELAAFARRSGRNWFVGVLNGPRPAL